MLLRVIESELVGDTRIDLPLQMARRVLHQQFITPPVKFNDEVLGFEKFEEYDDDDE